MKHVVVTVALIFALSAFPASAAEGMWQPHQMPELAGELRSLGLELDPSSMTRLTEFPMNAVISLGGCTASFVSSEGLVVTNHHCAYGSLQFNSSEEQNLLEDGFLAESRGDELPASPGQRVYVTVDVEDVTRQMTRGLSDGMDPSERYKTLEDRDKQLVATCESDPGHRCRVSSFHGGLQYFLTKRMELRDVRLVYAPAGSIGVFGGDIDNWTWPRHTGDFAFYRAYVGPDGAPADHAEENVPYRPKHFLRVQPRGVQDSDLVMVMGYPGRTSRYRLAREIETRFGWSYPHSREILLEMLEIIEQETADRPDAVIKYASTVAGLNNTTKNYGGMLDGYAASGMLERKLAREHELQAWIEADPARKKSYGTVLDELNELIESREATQERDSLRRYLGRGSMISTARRLYRLSRERELPDADREPGYQERDLTRIRQRLERLDRRYDAQVDQAVWSHLIGRYRALPEEMRVPAFDRFLGLNKVEADLDRRLQKMYEATELDELQTRLDWMEASREEFEASKDPFIRLAVAIYDEDRRLEREAEERSGRFLRVRPKFMEAMIAFEQSRGKPVYADANGTLRVTYGQVRGYSPRDGIVYTPFTKLEGIVEKYTGEDPFDSPDSQLELIRERRHGDYANAGIGSVPVNFLSSVDTTGGNSGSPTVNGRGELVGLLFDGTYDSINADWDFNVEKTRSIHVDVRYMLWVMQHVDRAMGLLRELGAIPAPAEKGESARRPPPGRRG